MPSNHRSGCAGCARKRGQSAEHDADRQSAKILARTESRTASLPRAVNQIRGLTKRPINPYQTSKRRNFRWSITGIPIRCCAAPTVTASSNPTGSNPTGISRRPPATTRCAKATPLTFAETRWAAESSISIVKQRCVRYATACQRRCSWAKRCRATCTPHCLPEADRASTRARSGPPQTLMESWKPGFTAGRDRCWL